MKNRYVDISIIRAIAMVCIIMCHIFQFYNLSIAWWLNIGVEVFLFMSGYLYGLKRIERPLKWIKHNLKKILLDYWVYFFIIRKPRRSVP